MAGSSEGITLTTCILSQLYFVAFGHICNMSCLYLVTLYFIASAMQENCILSNTELGLAQPQLVHILPHHGWTRGVGVRENMMGMIQGAGWGSKMTEEIMR